MAISFLLVEFDNSRFAFNDTYTKFIHVYKQQNLGQKRNDCWIGIITILKYIYIELELRRITHRWLQFTVFSNRHVEILGIKLMNKNEINSTFSYRAPMNALFSCYKHTFKKQIEQIYASTSNTFRPDGFPNPPIRKQ